MEKPENPQRVEFWRNIGAWPLFQQDMPILGAMYTGVEAWVLNTPAAPFIFYVARIDGDFTELGILIDEVLRIARATKKFEGRVFDQGPLLIGEVFIISSRAAAQIVHRTSRIQTPMQWKQAVAASLLTPWFEPSERTAEPLDVKWVPEAFRGDAFDFDEPAMPEPAPYEPPSAYGMDVVADYEEDDEEPEPFEEEDLEDGEEAELQRIFSASAES
jgi:hypothetical protein